MEKNIATEFQSQITSGRGSAIDAYRRVAYGQKSLFGLFGFELVTSLFGPMPGALGIVLRRIFYRRLFGSMGRGVVVGKNVTLRHPHKIHLGDNVVIDDYVVLDAKGDEKTGISMGDGVVLSRGTVLSCKGSSITIGDSANFAIGCVVHAAGPVHVGKYCLLAAHCYLVGVGNHGFDRVDIPMMAQPSISKGLELKDDVWLGSKVVVLDGVTIEKGSVIGACSMVNESIPEYCIALGIPAKVVRKRV